MSNEDVIQEALSDLRSMFGSRVPQNIAGSVITRWHSDEFSRGSYSYIASGSSFSDYRTLARSIDNQIFFAGEATHARYPGTVHGAYLSGERAAKEIMQSMSGGNNTTDTSDSNR
jgi:monoamine oxidase